MHPSPGLVPWVNVNVSPRSFREPTLVESVTAALERHRLKPNRLGIEITENLMSEQADTAIETLEELRTIGLRLALDDFGTGYSSLSYLQSLPVDVVKIAKPFIDGLEASASQRAFSTAIVALGEALGKFVIAEGIERSEQLDLLEAMGCDAGQGYMFARPMAGAEFVQWATQWRHRPLQAVIADVGQLRALRTAHLDTSSAY